MHLWDVFVDELNNFLQEKEENQPNIETFGLVEFKMNHSFLHHNPSVGSI